MDDLAMFLLEQLDADVKRTLELRARAAEDQAGWADVSPDDGPDRYMVGIESKRRIIAEHAADFTDGGPDDPRCRICRVENLEGVSDNDLDCHCANLDYPCPTLRLVALPYADRPGYRPEWSPDA